MNKDMILAISDLQYKYRLYVAMKKQWLSGSGYNDDGEFFTVFPWNEDVVKDYERALIRVQELKWG